MIGLLTYSLQVRDIRREGFLVFAGNGGFLSVGVYQTEWSWLRMTKGKLKHAPPAPYATLGEIAPLP